MKHNCRRRKLSIRTDQDDITKLEAFLDKICDDFHIYDDYYGNIIATVTAAHELITAITDSRKTVDIQFKSGPAGITFSVHLDDNFLHLAAKHQKVKAIDNSQGDNSDMLMEPDEADNKLMLLDLLSDDLQFLPEEETMVISFHITGINDMLSMQRSQLLHNYYDRLIREQKTYQ